VFVPAKIKQITASDAPDQWHHRCGHRVGAFQLDQKRTPLLQPICAGLTGGARSAVNRLLKSVVR
jgi:hypothetical protein